MKALLYKFEGFIIGLLLAIAAAGVLIGVVEHMQYKELLNSMKKERPKYSSYVNYAKYSPSDEQYN